jgi:hypothetical protein
MEVIGRKSLPQSTAAGAEKAEIDTQILPRAAKLRERCGVLYGRTARVGSQNPFHKGECIMFMGWAFSTIVLVLFFLWYGLAEFVPALKTDMWMKVAAVLALLIAVLNLLHM